VKSTRNPRRGTAQRCGACLPDPRGGSTAANAKAAIDNRRPAHFAAACVQRATASAWQLLREPAHLACSLWAGLWQAACEFLSQSTG